MFEWMLGLKPDWMPGMQIDWKLSIVPDSVQKQTGSCRRQSLSVR